MKETQEEALARQQRVLAKHVPPGGWSPPVAASESRTPEPVKTLKEMFGKQRALRMQYDAEARARADNLESLD